MASKGFTDCKGKPIDKKVHGGVRAAFFIHFMVVMTNTINVPNFLNMVTYLHGTMHAGIAKSSNTATQLFAATCFFSLLGAFISDSYIKRIKTILIFGPLEFLGFGLLAIQAHFPSLHPPKCNVNQLEGNDCEQAHGLSEALYYSGMYIIAIGEGCVRACLSSLGGDQFDSDDPIELQQKSSFFNWYTFSISLGAFIGLTLIVWLENNKGWDIGFGVSAFMFLLGFLVLASGFSFYRNQIPEGSPLTRMMQVFVAAFRKRKLILPANLEDFHQIEEEDNSDIEVLSHTKGFRFLNKASIKDGNNATWSLCSVTQVEETKIILNMFPVFISSVIGSIPNALLLTFTVQQGSTMNTRLGKINISPATLFIIPVIFQLVALVIYDRLLVPFLQRITGYVGGITHLQRIGIGFASTAFATCAAALVERKRMKAVEEHGLQDDGGVIPLSVFWLGMQFFFLGIYDVTAFVGLLEFFTSEISRGMKSIGTSIFWCIIGSASLLSTFVVDLTNKATRHGDSGKGWLEGNNLNKSHLDRFYWLLFVLQLLALLNYLYWAKRYTYRQNPRLQDENILQHETIFRRKNISPSSVKMEVII